MSSDIPGRLIRLIDTEQTVADPAAAVRGRMAFDSNGEDDSFTLCKSLEGLNYELWSGAPEEGEPLWRAYYYLFYDSAEWVALACSTMTFLARRLNRRNQPSEVSHSGAKMLC